ncbi:hypothetical protein BDA96_01G522900, partial [Sorghum bicolor]
MGRPPCGDKEGVKKGPWTPEEDLVGVHLPFPSYLPRPLICACMQGCCGAARAAASGGPGIRRGGFSDQEDRLIVVHLQALLGNRWAAIASYLPDRTDNGVKNYWNTHVASLPPKGQRELKLPTDIDLL